MKEDKEVLLPRGEEYIFGEEAILENDIKILEEYRDDELFGVAGRQALENLLTRYKQIKKVLKRDIRECKSEIIATQGNKSRKDLSGASRRHLASLSGRQNEAIRILNILEGSKEDEDIKKNIL